jgi:hypothetical protein
MSLALCPVVYQTDSLHTKVTCHTYMVPRMSGSESSCRLVLSERFGQDQVPDTRGHLGHALPGERTQLSCRGEITMASLHNAALPHSTTNPASPPRYKVALLTWATVFPLLTAANVLFGPVLALLPLPARTLLLTGLVVGLTTYVVMPRLTQWFAGWLTPLSNRRGQDEGRHLRSENIHQS